MEQDQKISTVVDDIQSMNIPDYTKQQLQVILLKLLNEEQINIMITGATGCGKSSTINALFGKEVAKVGTQVGPETMKITKYELPNLTIWDTPGLGDGIEQDRQHAQNIINKLQEKDEKGNALIDIILVILDGGSRDLGTSYELINQVIIPTLGEEASKRVLVAINQADMAMKGRYWNHEKNEPEQKLSEFLVNKVESVRQRIKETTGIDITPVYYCAGFKEDGMEQRPYNLSKLLAFIVKYTPKRKRVILAKSLNDDPEVWADDDKQDKYMDGVKTGIWESLVEGCKKYAPIVCKKVIEYGPVIISMIPATGPVGKLISKVKIFFKK